MELVGSCCVDFRRRFLTLLSFKFREFGSVTALSVLEAANAGVKKLDEDSSRGIHHIVSLKDVISELFVVVELTSTELAFHMSPFDLKRLESYANNMLDYHAIMDLLPAVASFYFEKRFGVETRLSAVQSSILLALGLQRKTIEEVEVRNILSMRYRYIRFLGDEHMLTSAQIGRATVACQPSSSFVRQARSQIEQTSAGHSKSGNRGYDPGGTVETVYSTKRGGCGQTKHHLDTRRDELGR